MRLVPNQDWEEITELFTKHFMSIAPAGVTVKVKPHHGGQGYVTPIGAGYNGKMAYTETLEFQLFRYVLEVVSQSLPYLKKRTKKQNHPNGFGLTAMPSTRQMSTSGL
jgi:hypothetical protein